MIALLLTGFTYAFWVGEVGAATKDYTGETVVVGVANNTTTSIEFDEANMSDPNKRLVPTGQVEYSVGGAAENTNVKTLTVPVKWVQDEKKINPANVDGTITATANLTVGNLDANQIARLFTVEVVDGQTVNLDGKAEVVTVTITMNDEVLESEYLEVSNSQLQVTVNFEVENN